MATPRPKLAAQPIPYRPDRADSELRKLRSPAGVRAFAAARFTGARNSAVTGLGLLSNAGFDIFDAASAVANQGENPYNNWLTKESKPIFDFFPKAIGVHIGGAGDDATKEIGQLIIEHSILEVKKENTPIVRQPLLTLPPGVGLDRVITDSAGGTFFWSRNGQNSPAGLFQLGNNVVFERNHQVKAILKTAPDAITAIAALAGNFPTEGMIIAVVVYGVGEFGVGTLR